MIDPKIQSDLNNCKTVQEMFDILSANFKLDKCQLNIVSRQIFIIGFNKAFNMVKPEIRK